MKWLPDGYHIEPAGRASLSGQLAIFSADQKRKELMVYVIDEQASVI